MGLAYDRLGSGPPLVLLHGTGHRRQAWNAVLDRLTPHREVIVIDLPGHGQSPPLRRDGKPVLDEMLSAITGLFGVLDLLRPHIAGNSLGGRLALEAAAAGHAATVTALSPAGFWRSERDAMRSKAILRGMLAVAGPARPVASAIARSTAGRAVAFSTVVTRPSRLTASQARGDLMAFADARDAILAVLAEITPCTSRVPAQVPVTIAWGTKDRLLPPRQILAAKALLPKARLVPLPGCGHVPMTDDPALVADVLLRGSGALPV